MHSCWYLQVCTEGGGAKTDCSTVLGLFTSRSEGGIHVLTYRCAFFSFSFFFCWGVGSRGRGRGGVFWEVKGHMHGVRERERTAEYISGGDTKTEHSKETFTANWTTSRPPHMKPCVACEYAQHGLFFFPFVFDFFFSLFP